MKLKDLLDVIDTNHEIDLHFQDDEDIYCFAPIQIEIPKDSMLQDYGEYYINRIYALEEDVLRVEIYEDEHIFE